LRKAFINHRIRADRNVIPEFDRPKKFRARTDVAIIANAGSCHRLPGGRPDVDACMYATVCANLRSCADDERSVMGDRQPRTENVGGYRESQKPAEARYPHHANKAVQRLMAAIAVILKRAQ